MLMMIMTIKLMMMIMKDCNSKQRLRKQKLSSEVAPLRELAPVHYSNPMWRNSADLFQGNSRCTANQSVIDILN